MSETQHVLDERRREGLREAVAVDAGVMCEPIKVKPGANGRREMGANER